MSDDKYTDLLNYLAQRLHREPNPKMDNALCDYDFHTWRAVQGREFKRRGERYERRAKFLVNARGWVHHLQAWFDEALEREEITAEEEKIGTANFHILWNALEFAEMTHPELMTYSQGECIERAVKLICRSVDNPRAFIE